MYVYAFIPGKIAKYQFFFSVTFSKENNWFSLNNK